jgi:hypothetical protein
MRPRCADSWCLRAGSVGEVCVPVVVAPTESALGLACGVLAHNLYRWTAEPGDLRPDGKLTVARTLRTRVVALPARLVNRAGRWILRLPARWPWAQQFLTALTRLRTMPLLT